MDRVDDWIGIAVGLFCTGISTVSIWRGVSALRWPATGGRVTELAVEKSRRGGKSLTVRYEYEVEGIRYTADRLTFGLVGWRSPDKAARHVLSLKPGDAVQVFYSPDKSAQAVLRPGVTFTTFWLLAIGLIFLITSVGAFRALLRSAP